MRQLDLEAIETLKDVMEDDFAVLLDTFFEDSVFRLQELKTSLEGQDTDALRRAAHSFKGSASNLGALALADLCMQVESLAAKNSLSGVDTLLKSIAEEYAAVEAMLKAYL